MKLFLLICSFVFVNSVFAAGERYCSVCDNIQGKCVTRECIGDNDECDATKCKKLINAKPLPAVIIGPQSTQQIAK